MASRKITRTSVVIDHLSAEFDPAHQHVIIKDTLRSQIMELSDLDGLRLLRMLEFLHPGDSGDTGEADR